MTGALSSAQRLRRISEALREGRLPDPDDALPVADGIEAWLSGDLPSLDAALGIASTGRGGISARRALALAERDRALLDLAHLLGGGEAINENSEIIWDVVDALEGYLDIEDDRRWQDATRLVRVILAANNGRTLSRRQVLNILA